MKYLINCDKLVLKLKQGPKTLFKFYDKISLFDQKPFFKVNSRIHLIRSDDRHSRYHQVYILKLDNHIFGIIKLYPYIDPGSTLITISITVSNLYIGFVPGLRYILSTLDLSLHNISYLDICLDSQTDFTSTIIEHFLNPDTVLVSSNKIKHDLDKYSKLYKDGNEDITLYIGSKRSDKQVVSYNKTKDPKLKDKPYQRELYLKEFNNDKDVYRLEVRLNNTSFVKYRSKGEKTEVSKMDIDIFRLNETDYLVSIFSHFFTRMVDFRKRTNKVITRCEKITLIDFDNINIYPLKTDIKLQETKNNDYKIEKSFMKKCVKEYLLNCNPKNYKNVEVFFDNYIRPIEPLNQWYKEYLEKNHLKISPPQDDTKRFSLFDYKRNRDKITEIQCVGYQ